MFGSKKLSDALAMPRSPSHSLHRSTSRHRLVGENVTEIGVCIARDSRLTRSELEEELRAPGTCGLLKNLPKARGRRVRGCFEEANDPGTSPVFAHGRKPSGLAGVRHCKNELGLASCVAACIEVEAAAATQPSERIVPVLAKVFEPWKLKGTSLSPMAASLIVLCATVPARQTELNRSHSRDNSVTRVRYVVGSDRTTGQKQYRSEEHTSELQSHSDLVCRLLLE